MVSFSKKGTKNKSKKYCSVPQCHSKLSSDIALHHFPKDERRKTLWAIALRIGKPVTNYMYVCSLHFLEEDYILPDANKKRQILKKYAVPSQNLPITGNDSVPTDELEKSKEMRAQWAKHLNEFTSFTAEDIPLGECTTHPTVIYIQAETNT